MPTAAQGQSTYDAQQAASNASGRFSYAPVALASNPTVTSAPITPSTTGGTPSTLGSGNAPTYSPAVITSNLAKDNLNTVKADYSQIQQGMAAQAANNAAQKALQDQADQEKTVQANADKAAATKAATDQTNAQAKLAAINASSPVPVAVPNAGDTVTDTSGATGIAKFDPNTGKPLAQPVAAGDMTAENTQYQSDQQQILNDTQQEYSNYRNQIQQLTQGTFPLSSAQQALVTSTSQAFDSMIEQANNRGLALSSETGGFSNKVSSALGAIANIDARKAASVASLEQGFQDQNYKMITESYNQFKDYETQKSSTLAALHDDVIKQSEIMRDQYNKDRDLKLEQDKVSYQKEQDKIQNDMSSKKLADDLATNELQREKLKADIQNVQENLPSANVSTMSASPTNVSYYNAVANASIGLPTTQRAEIAKNLNQLLASGDTKGAQELIIRTAFQGQTGTQQQASIQRAEALDALGTVKSILADYTAKKGDTNLVKGNIQEIQQKLGNAGDPEAAKVNARITQALQIYRNAITGAAWGTQETDEYKKLFPSLTNTNKLNTAIIDSMTDALNSNQRITLGSYIGQSTYDSIFQPEKTTEPNSSINIAQKVATAQSGGYSPDEILGQVSNIPQYTSFVSEAQKDGWSPDEIISYLKK